jgi:anti-anti-sigma factor
MPSEDIVERIEITDQSIEFSLTGEFDLATTPTARETISGAFRATPRPLFILDLRSVYFIDSAGLALLISLHKSSVVNGILNVVAMPGTQPERVLRLGRFDTLITILFQTSAMSSSQQSAALQA